MFFIAFIIVLWFVSLSMYRNTYLSESTVEMCLYICKNTVLFVRMSYCKNYAYQCCNCCCSGACTIDWALFSCFFEGNSWSFTKYLRLLSEILMQAWIIGFVVYFVIKKQSALPGIVFRKGNDILFYHSWSFFKYICKWYKSCNKEWQNYISFMNAWLNFLKYFLFAL